MEVFTSEDAKQILWKKFVVVIGDSVQRCVYKDLVCLLGLNSNTAYLSTKELKAKGELEFLGDKLISGGQLGDVKTGIKYREVRLYDGGSTLLKFYFVTRCYSDHVQSVLNEVKAIQPHVVIMNSCLWDLHRYGPRGPESYRNNMNKLTTALRNVVPNDAVFIWNATLPLASKCKGGLFLPYYDNIPSQEILEANFAACDVVRSHQFTFLDLHSTFRHQLHLRANDGIHWNSIAHRRISNLLLHQLCRLWNLPVPRIKMLTEPLLPTPLPPLPPLRERPLSSSYSMHSQLDRYNPNVNPYEFDSPVCDKRYIVESPDDHTSSYKDRFRLISTPIPSPINSPVTKPEPTLENHPCIEENISTPLYTSSPVEPGFKTRSFTDIELEAERLPVSDIDYDAVPEEHLRQILLLNQQLNRERKAFQNANNEDLNTATVTSSSTTTTSSVSLPSKEFIVEPQAKQIADVPQQMTTTLQMATNCNKENTPCNTNPASCATPIQEVSTVQSWSKEVNPPPTKPVSQPSINQAPLQGYPSPSTMIQCQSESTSLVKSVDKRDEVKIATPKKVSPERSTYESTKSNVPSCVDIDASKEQHSQPSENQTKCEPSSKGMAVKTKEEEGKGVAVKTKEKGEAKEKGVIVKNKENGNAVKPKEEGAVKTTSSSQHSRGHKRKASDSLDCRKNSKIAKVEIPGSKVEQKCLVKSSSSRSSEHSVPKPSTSTSVSRGQKRKASDSSDSSWNSKSSKVEGPTSKVSQKSEVQRPSSSTTKQNTSKTSDSTSASGGHKHKASDSQCHPSHSKISKADKPKVISMSSRSSTPGSSSALKSSVSIVGHAKVVSTSSRSSTPNSSSALKSSVSIVGHAKVVSMSSRSSTPSSSSALKSSVSVSGHAVGSPIPVYTGYPMIEQPMVNSNKYSITSRQGHQRSNSMMAAIPVHSGLSAPVPQYPTYNTNWPTLPNQMTHTELAHHQMMVNSAIHHRQSYPPPLNPHMNSWDLYRGYYYHGNKRY